MSGPSVSVVLPSYNEAEGIVAVLSAVLANIPPDAEVILVDDDSPDGTAKVARAAFTDEPRVRVMVKKSEHGLAKAIRSGIEAASGVRCVVMDSDLNHDPRDIPRLLAVSEVADMVSGSRFAPGGNMEPRRRYIASFVYNLAIRVLLHTQVQDNLCGFFVMRRAAVLGLPLDAIFFGFGDYYFRLIHYAQRQRYSIVEIPTIVRPRQRGEAKNRLMRTFLQYTKELARFVIWR